MIEEPICNICHTSKYVTPLYLSVEFNACDIRYGDNGWQKVKLFACGKCGTVSIDRETKDMIVKRRDLKDGNN